MSDILSKILATKEQEIEVGKHALPIEEISARAAGLPATRGFTARMRNAADASMAVIAEIKKASPSAGVIRPNFQPREIAKTYEAGGATCLSVLTDVTYFQGAPDYLNAARESCSLPLLRKDFIIDPWQVHESRVLGADCILLIVAALSRDSLQELEGLARGIGLDVLVEVHHEAELESALTTDAQLIGVNNRDLRNFHTDLSVSEYLRPKIPAGRLMVTESGIHSATDVRRMLAADVRAFLVGEAFMRAADPGLALKNLFHAEEAETRYA